MAVLSSKKLSKLIFLVSLLIFSSFVSVSSAQVDASVDDEVITDADLEDSSSSGTDVVATPSDSSGDVSSEEDSFSLEPAKGVSVSHVFPGYYGKAVLIPAGQKTQILVGVANGGQTPLTILGIRGGLFLTYDYQYAVQNFSTPMLNVSVAVGDQATFPLDFIPDRMLQPRDFGFAATLFYHLQNDETVYDESSNSAVPKVYASVAYNGTLEVIEPVGFVSGESVFLTMLGLVLLGFGAVWAYGRLEKAAKKSKKSKRVETGTDSTDDDTNEWLQGTSVVQKQQTTIAQPVKSRKKRFA